MTKKMINSVLLVIGTIAFLSINSCKQQPPTDLSKAALIPLPVSIEAGGGSFALYDQTKIYVSSESNEAFDVGIYLAGLLKPATGFGFKVLPTNAIPDNGNIFLILSGSQTQLGDEGYELVITDEIITIKAFKPAGLFYGVQTLRQLLPMEIETKSQQQISWHVATGTITDYPRYAYRGSMLDVSRHFFGVDDIKRYIDLLAAYKMNVLHLHLSDDQGWRIEIKSWPKLTTVGGSTAVGGGKGGFYTQEQYTEIVNYAKERYITIVPEIDLPGHTNAALASYAGLNCDNKKRELYTGTKVGFSTLCTRNENTYAFVDSVIRELAAITPGPFIHIGGDEPHSTEKEDYIYFINRVQDIVQLYGKQMIGWEEIVQADLKTNPVVQYWANEKYALKAIEKGAKLIMSPAWKIYLDMQYDSTSPLGLHWAGYIEVDSAYLWDPAQYVDGISDENILGVECPLWSETLLQFDDIEYMLFPRMPGYAEIGWSPAEKRNWEEYKVRLGKHSAWFEVKKINYYPSDKINWQE